MEELMRRTVFGVTLIALSIALGGCGLFGGGDDSDVVFDDAVIESATEITEPSEFPSPAAKVKPVIATNAGLVRPTDPDERLRAIQSGRSDPFASLITPAKSGPENKNLQAFLKRQPPANFSKPSLSRSNLTPPKAVLPSPKVVLPPLPKADLAKAVKVTGIVTLGGEPQAIVQAPNESVSRTVRVGDRLSGGQVMVKAIDLSNRAEPVLILEEAGIEVTIGIGRPASESVAYAPGRN